MNELNLQIEYVQRHPRDHIAALVLVDRIEEERECTRREALRTVADFVVVARNVHAVLLATRICRKGARYFYAVEVLVGWHVGEPEARFNMLIRDGWQPPVYCSSPRGTRRGRQRTPWVTVGARWLIVTLRNHLRRLARIKKKLKPEKPKAKWRRSVEKFKRSQTNTRNTRTEYHT